MKTPTWCRCAAGVLLLLLPAAAGELTISPEAAQALERISADSLKGHVSFLASDLLEGRRTPSQGLEIAGEYIAAQFRRAGLEPGGDDGYFQNAEFLSVTPDNAGVTLEFRRGERTIRVPNENLEAGASLQGVDVSAAPVVKASLLELLDASKWPAERLRGKVLLTDVPSMAGLDEAARRKLRRAMRVLPDNVKPAAVLVLLRGRFPRDTATRLGDPADPALAGVPRFQVFEAELRKIYEALPSGDTDLTVTLKAPAPAQEKVKLRNVVGILRGSDPVLRDTYVLVTAHYDHLGTRTTGEGDRILNGANDDASGTASVLELAAAMSSMKVRPKRSIVFMTFFGEELGLYGSRFYARHPAVPLEKTVADINLEHLGRTDDSEGPLLARASVTGFDYSDVGPLLAKAGELVGVTVAKRDRVSDSAFAQSDNQPLADVGIPAHTVMVTYMFRDYHQPGDEWPKLDYDNMAKIDRMAALGVLALANDGAAPKWNPSNGKAEAYFKAWKERKGN